MRSRLILLGSKPACPRKEVPAELPPERDSPTQEGSQQTDTGVTDDTSIQAINRETQSTFTHPHTLRHTWTEHHTYTRAATKGSQQARTRTHKDTQGHKDTYSGHIRSSTQRIEQLQTHHHTHASIDMDIHNSHMHRDRCLESQL